MKVTERLISSKGNIVFVDRILTPYEEQQFRRVMNARRIQEDEAQMAYYKEHKHGYCPICHLLKVNGKCDLCD